MKKYKKEVEAAQKYGSGVTTVGDVTECRDGAGNVVKRIVKPIKRALTEVIDDDLANFVVVKRQKTARVRTPTGNSTASEASSAAEPAATPVAVMPAIAEEPESPNAAHEEPIVVEDIVVLPEGVNVEEELARYQASVDAGIDYLALGQHLLSENVHPNNATHDHYLTPPANEGNSFLVAGEEQPQQLVYFEKFFDLDKYLNSDSDEPTAGIDGSNDDSHVAE